jgi:hypothetical protein
MDLPLVSLMLELYDLDTCAFLSFHRRLISNNIGSHISSDFPKLNLLFWDIYGSATYYITISECDFAIS